MPIQTLGLMGSAMLTAQILYPEILARIPAGWTIVPEEFVTVHTATRALAQSISGHSLAKTNLVVYAGRIPLGTDTPLRKKDLPALDRIAGLLQEMSPADYTESALRAASALQQGGIELIQREELASRVENIFTNISKQRGQKTFPPRARTAMPVEASPSTRRAIDWTQKLKEWDAKELAFFILEQPEAIESHVERILKLATKNAALGLALAYLAWKTPEIFPPNAITTLLNAIGSKNLHWVPAWTLESIRYPKLIQKMMGAVETPTIGLSWTLYFLVKSRSKEVSRNKKLMLGLSTAGYYNSIVRHAHNLALQKNPA
ncbi:MAG: hypothetical protein Q8P84_06425 [Deltaproteobacteria bacterium]|nr:hypothetical protein [Deltaproteobacteria bacterium]